MQLVATQYPTPVAYPAVAPPPDIGETIRQFMPVIIIIMLMAMIIPMFREMAGALR